MYVWVVRILDLPLGGWLEVFDSQELSDKYAQYARDRGYKVSIIKTELRSKVPQ